MKRVGIIGCGGIARGHARALQSMKDIRLTAFCDLELQRAKALAEECHALEGGGKPDNESRIVRDWRELCEMDLDVVHVCTPHDLHAPMAAELLKSGKGAFVEKPCAISVEQFEALKEEDAKHPGKLGFCFQNRYNATTLLMDELLKEGRIGRITGGRAFVTWRRDEEYYLGSSWKGKLKTEGGGVLINQSIHTLDLLLRYLGNPETVRGSVARHHFRDEQIEVEDTVEAWLEFAGGRRACFYASTGYVADAPVLLELQGETGRICMNGAEVTIYPGEGTPGHWICDRGAGTVKGYWGRGHKACIEDYYQRLQDGKDYQNNLQGVENTFLTMMKIYQKE